MITIAGPDSDWDQLADFLNDPTWSGSRMRGYFRRLEHNDYLPVPNLSRRSPLEQLWHYIRSYARFVRGRSVDSTSGKHGFEGWLHTSLTDVRIGLKDTQLVKMLAAALKVAKKQELDNAWTLVKRFFRGDYVEALDPNHSETMANSPEGIVMVPLAVHGRRTTIHQNAATPYAMLGRRSSPREFLVETQAAFPNNLEICTDCLVTRLLFDDDNAADEPRNGESPGVNGVEFLHGERLYRAHVNPNEDLQPTKHEIRVRKGGEVILCGGAFNTPQLLLLSGIGERQQLEKTVSTVR